MKSYAFYPGTKFQSPVARFVTPYYPSYTTRSQVTNTPATNIERQEGSYVIRMAVPGLGKNDIRIEVDNDQLLISAVEMKNESNSNEVKNESNPNYVRREFDYSNFKRSFRLHKNANAEAMTASFEQGILTIVVPDKEPETRKIEIL